MADMSDYKKQEWIDKENELLGLANYECEEDHNEHAQRVHICYYLKGKDIWNLPKDAYKCYCKDHWERRRNTESALRVKLAAFSINELDVLHDALERLPKNNRAQIIEQVFSEARRKVSDARQKLYSDDDESRFCGSEEEFDE